MRSELEDTLLRQSAAAAAVAARAAVAHRSIEQGMPGAAVPETPAAGGPHVPAAPVPERHLLDS